MSKHARRFAQLATAAVLSIGALLPVHAETRAYEFTFDWDDGPLAGQVTTGRFSFDANLFHPTDYVQADQLFSQLHVVIDGHLFTEAQAPGHYLRFHPDGALRMMAVGNNCGPVTCYTDNPQDWAIAWDGRSNGFATYVHSPNVFSWAEVMDVQAIAAVPEPHAGALALLGLAMLGWRWRDRGCN